MGALARLRRVDSLGGSWSLSGPVPAYLPDYLTAPTAVLCPYGSLSQWGSGPKGYKPAKAPRRSSKAQGHKNKGEQEGR